MTALNLLVGAAAFFAALGFILGVSLIYGGPDELAVFGLLSFGLAALFGFSAAALHFTRR